MPVLARCLPVLLAVACDAAGWPERSEHPVSSLHPPAVLEERLAELSPPAAAGYRFVVFGDQRALAGGEWQRMMRRIGELSRRDDRLAFMIDTGDIVGNGRYSDQFRRLRGILAPAGDLPYLVAIGNHEVNKNQRPAAREHTAAFLAYLDPALAPERLYYVKDIGPARFIFLDSNDFVYGDEGDGSSYQRARLQVHWLEAILARDDEAKITFAALHHPFVMSSRKHRGQAKALWNAEFEGRHLPEILIEGGVDVVLTGHTHTYERFLLRRGGRSMHVVNISGRPRGFLSGSRSARDLSGRTEEALAGRGWRRLDAWTIRQEEAMSPGEEANQFAVISIDEGGAAVMDVYFLDGRHLRRSLR